VKSNGRSLTLTTLLLSVGQRRATRCFAGAVVAAASLLGVALPSAAAAPTLVVVILGNGGVVSKPAGISCPGACTATFAAGTSVVLIATPKTGSTFLRWGGPCTGSGACTVKVSSLTAVAAQFTAGAKPKSPPTTNRSVAVPGSYTGDYAGHPEDDPVSLFVSPGGTSVLNISVPNMSIACSPAGSFPGADHLGILKTPIEPNGSFATTATQEGVFGNTSAKFTYSFTGRFRGATSAGVPSAAGTLREDIVFPTGGTTERCTSNDQSWTVTHDPQPGPTKSVATPGSYTGDYAGHPEDDPVTFFVSPGGTSVLNISVPTIDLACAPALSFPGSDHLGILETPIEPNGSFAATATQEGVFGNTSAKFTYSFTGFVEGATPAGPVTLAGILREDVVFATSGTTERCTSNDQSWTVTHDPQPGPAKSVATPGSYTGDYAGHPEDDPVTFSVSRGGTSVLNISVPNMVIACAPAGSFPGRDHLGILETPIGANGSFAATATQEGVFGNTSAKFTYSFTGFVEGATPTGTATVAGILREDIVFVSSGTTELCTSNDQSWVASRS
jgi:hypothetical protein